MNEFVSVHVSDEQPGIATLLLSRPPTNALTRQVYREIVGAAADVGRRDDITAVIVFGGHEIFSAGDDVPELRTLNADEADVADRVCREAVDALAAIPKPTVAAITGYALGGGLTWRWPRTGGSAATTSSSARPRSLPGWCPRAAPPGWSRDGGREQGQGPGVHAGGSSTPRRRWRWA